MYFLVISQDILLGSLSSVMGNKVLMLCYDTNTSTVQCSFVLTTAVIFKF